MVKLVLITNVDTKILIKKHIGRQIFDQINTTNTQVMISMKFL